MAGSPDDVEAELRRLRAEHAQLLVELQHRVRNVLATIRSVTRRSADTCLVADDLAMHLDGRLGAITRAQGMILRDPAANQDLAQLVAEELFVYRAREGEQVTLSGDPVAIRPTAVEPLTLAFHELATNALKFGALSRPGGHVAVSWQEDAEARNGASDGLVIEWREAGGPRLAGQPDRCGFGSELLERSLPYELKAEVTLAYEPDGLRCRIRLPAAAWSRSAPSLASGPADDA